jgi:hypothetical protein
MPYNHFRRPSSPAFSYPITKMYPATIHSQHTSTNSPNVMLRPLPQFLIHDKSRLREPKEQGPTSFCVTGGFAGPFSTSLPIECLSIPCKLRISELAVTCGPFNCFSFDVWLNISGSEGTLLQAFPVELSVRFGFILSVPEHSMLAQRTTIQARQ